MARIRLGCAPGAQGLSSTQIWRSWVKARKEGAELSADLFPVLSPRILGLFRWVQVGLGWILAAFFVAGVAGIVRKE